MTTTALTDEIIIAQAMQILESRVTYGDALTNPADTVKYLQLKLSRKEQEVFAVVFLDNRHRVISYEEMFNGTLDQASVYPREIAKRALQLNAAAVIYAHNHPSGVAEPSQADRNLTEQLKKALELLGVRSLDHIVVGPNSHVSFAERGWL